MKIVRLLLISLLVILLFGTVGLVGWATVRAQPATERAVAMLQENGIERQEAFYSAMADSAEGYVIEGGNHRQYADYSFQPDDGVATISAAEQQDQIILATVQFLDTLE